MSEEGEVPGRRQRPRDHVVSTLAKQILSGEIRPGEKLPPEADLGSQLSVSRTALRESIRTLAGKGLIVSRTRTGTIVQPSSSWNHLDPELLAWRETMEPDIAFVTALIEARQVIEPAAAALAAERATGQDLAAIETAFLDMQQAARAIENIEEVVKADEAFHFALLAASHNPFFATFGAVIGSALRISFRVTTSASRNFPKSLAIHGEVLEAVRLRQPETARALMTDLVGVACDDLASALSGEGIGAVDG